MKERDIHPGAVNDPPLPVSRSFAGERPRVEARGVKRNLAIIVVFTLLFLVMILSVTLTIPSLLAQASELVEQVPALPGQQEQVAHAERHVADERAEEEYERRTEGVPAPTRLRQAGGEEP
jgi:predicted PurR-regulated permease PerM